MSYCCNCQLFDTDCIRKVTGMQFDFTDESLQSAIKLATDRNILPILGDCYSTLCTAKTEGVLTSIQESLIEKLEPVFAWSVLAFRLAQMIKVRSSGIELQVDSDENSIAVINSQRRGAIENVQFYAEASTKFIKDNKTSFPCLPEPEELCKKVRGFVLPFQTTNSKIAFGRYWVNCDWEV